MKRRLRKDDWISQEDMLAALFEFVQGLGYVPMLERHWVEEKVGSGITHKVLKTRLTFERGDDGKENDSD